LPDDTGSSRRPPLSPWDEIGRRPGTAAVSTLLVWAAVVCLLIALPGLGGAPEAGVASTVGAGVAAVETPELPLPAVAPSGIRAVWGRFFPIEVVIGFAILLGLSAFFSSSEIAFFTLTRWKLRSMQEEGTVRGRLVARLMEHPGKFLSTVLVGNTVVNVLIGILLGTRAEAAFEALLEGPVAGPAGEEVQTATAYVLAVVLTTGLLVFFGEIIPKVFAVRLSEAYVRLAVLPMMAAERVFHPVAQGVLWLTNAIFHATRFHEIHAAPFITDEEFKAVLFEGEAQGVIDEDERQMIQGILEFRDVLLREILIPRPDVVALPETATVADALQLLHDEEYSRVPVYAEDLDHITGILFMKDLLPSFAKGDRQREVRELARPAYFVPEIMTVKRFVEDTQRQRVHLAIAVDEYGGTAGIVTLQDAIEEVVGDIPAEEEEPEFVKVSDTEYRMDGSFSLDEFNELTGIAVEDEEHETLGGFLMDLSEKVLEPGDVIEHPGAVFRVEKMDGKRVESVRVDITPQPQEEDHS
jgi:putative hemolysin